MISLMSNNKSHQMGRNHRKFLKKSTSFFILFFFLILFLLLFLSINRPASPRLILTSIPVPPSSTASAATTSTPLTTKRKQVTKPPKARKLKCTDEYNARNDVIQQQRIETIRQVAHASRSAQSKKPNVYFPSPGDLIQPTAWPAVPGILSSAAGDIPILTYGMSDRFISGSILRYHKWENEHRKQMVQILSKDKGMGLIDIGCNIGVYALTAAKYGRKVVAIDANRYNLLMLGKSLQMSPTLKEHVTMVHNALSNEYGRVKIGIVPNNIGGSAVSKLKEGNVNKTLDLTNEAESILLDDLLSIIPFRRAVMKIDIEGFEHFALAGAERLFKEVDIVTVFMEWNTLRDLIKIRKGVWPMEFIYQFFTSRGYKAYNPDSGRALGPSYCDWTYDIVWKR